MVTTTYKYKPLATNNSIRILRLHPRNQDVDGQLTAKLVEVHVDSAPKYDAISYVWGKRLKSAQLLVHDEQNDDKLGEIRFTGNGYDVLRRLQHKEKTRLLWLDALCINQNDVAEREHQVTIMGQIYSNAHCVHIWLPSDNETAAIQSRMLSTRALLQLFRLVPSEFHRWLPVSVILILLTTILFDVPRDFARIASFPWFSRVWTLQELAFSRRCLLYVGQKKPFNGNTLYNSPLLTLLSPLGNVSDNPFHLFSVRTQARAAVQKDDPFLVPFMIPSLRNLQSTIPHDKVFALYPIIAFINEDLASNLKIDYSRPVESTFHDLAIAIIEGIDNITMLLEVPGIRESHSCISWVPDLLIPARRPYLAESPYDIPPEASKMSLTSDKKGLWIKGSIFSNVRATVNHSVRPTPKRKVAVAQFKITAEEEEALCLLVQWYNIAVGQSGDISSVAEQFFLTCAGGVVEQAVWLAIGLLPLVARRLPTDSLSPFEEWHDACEVYRLFWTWIQSKSRSLLKQTCAYFGPLLPYPEPELARRLVETIGSETSSDNAQLLPAQNLIHDLFAGKLKGQEMQAYDPSLSFLESFDIMTDRQFFVLDNRYFGLTIGHAKPGDQIAFVPALARPAILRAHKNESASAYEFVGAAEGVGIMPPWDEPWKSFPTIWDNEKLLKEPLDDLLLV